MFFNQKQLKQLYDRQRRFLKKKNASGDHRVFFKALRITELFLKGENSINTKEGEK